MARAGCVHEVVLAPFFFFFFSSHRVQSKVLFEIMAGFQDHDFLKFYQHLLGLWL